MDRGRGRGRGGGGARGGRGQQQGQQQQQQSASDSGSGGGGKGRTAATATLAAATPSGLTAANLAGTKRGAQQQQHQQQQGASDAGGGGGGKKPRRRGLGGGAAGTPATPQVPMPRIPAAPASVAAPSKIVTVPATVPPMSGRSTSTQSTSVAGAPVRPPTLHSQPVLLRRMSSVDERGLASMTDDDFLAEMQRDISKHQSLSTPAPAPASDVLGDGVEEGELQALPAPPAQSPPTAPTGSVLPVDRLQRFALHRAVSDALPPLHLTPSTSRSSSAPAAATGPVAKNASSLCSTESEMRPTASTQPTAPLLVHSAPDSAPSTMLLVTSDSSVQNAVSPTTRQDLVNTAEPVVAASTSDAVESVSVSSGKPGASPESQTIERSTSSAPSAVPVAHLPSGDQLDGAPVSSITSSSISRDALPSSTVALLPSAPYSSSERPKEKEPSPVLSGEPSPVLSGDNSSPGPVPPAPTLYQWGPSFGLQLSGGATSALPAPPEVCLPTNPLNPWYLTDGMVSVVS
jgi:hypothetical protein